MVAVPINDVRCPADAEQAEATEVAGLYGDDALAPEAGEAIELVKDIGRR